MQTEFIYEDEKCKKVQLPNRTSNKLNESESLYSEIFYSIQGFLTTSEPQVYKVSRRCCYKKQKKTILLTAKLSKVK